MSSLLEKLAYKLVPEGKEAEKAVELDDRLLATPTIALAEAEKLVRKMAGEAVDGFRLALASIERYDARLRRAYSKHRKRYRSLRGYSGHVFCTKISRYQIGEDDSAEVSKLLKVIGDFERIADHSVNVLESVEELNAKKIAFSCDAQKELSGALCSGV